MQGLRRQKILRYISMVISRVLKKSVRKYRKEKALRRSQVSHLRFFLFAVTHHCVHGGILGIDMRRTGRVVRAHIVIEMVGQTIGHFLQMAFHRRDAFADEYQNDQPKNRNFCKDFNNNIASEASYVYFII